MTVLEHSDYEQLSEFSSQINLLREGLKNPKESIVKVPRSIVQRIYSHKAPTDDNKDPVLFFPLTYFAVFSFQNGYTKDHPTIQNFWSVFHNDLTEEDKKKFLLFLTGCDRIPNTGMKSLSMIIQKTGDVHHLPVAHTCFNILDLPEYATKEKLHYKLMKAIQYSEGFGLV